MLKHGPSREKNIPMLEGSDTFKIFIDASCGLGFVGLDDLMTTRHTETLAPKKNNNPLTINTLLRR